MTDAERLEELRRLFLSAPEAAVTRFVAIALSGVVFILVLWLVRKRALREEYTPIWMGTAFALMVVSLRSDWLHAMTRAAGAWTSSSLIFFLGEVFLVAICLNYAVRLSRASDRIRSLAQQLALLEARVARMDAGARRG